MIIDIILLFAMAVNQNMLYWQFSIHQALSMLEDDIDNIQSADIYVQPLGDGTNSDEGSRDEESLNGLDVNNLPGSQLQADAEAVLHTFSGPAISIDTENSDTAAVSLKHLSQWNQKVSSFL